jgi:hypothetical protein
VHDDLISILDHVGKPRKPVESMFRILWKRAKQQFSWSTDQAIVLLVEYFLSDVLYECRLPLELVDKLGTFELRPDLRVILIGGVPVGVIEVKMPGSNVLEHEFVLGELYDCSIFQTFTVRNK